MIIFSGGSKLDEDTVMRHHMVVIIWKKQAC